MFWLCLLKPFCQSFLYKFYFVLAQAFWNWFKNLVGLWRKSELVVWYFNIKFWQCCKGVGMLVSENKKVCSHCDLKMCFICENVYIGRNANFEDFCFSFMNITIYQNQSPFFVWDLWPSCFGSGACEAWITSDYRISAESKLTALIIIKKYNRFSYIFILGLKNTGEGFF